MIEKQNAYEKTLYLHVGTPKTGTSAIQKFCLWNRELLQEKGYAFPTFPHKFSNIPESRNGYFLVARVRNYKGEILLDKEHKIFEKYMAEVLKQSKDCRNIIISNEDLWRKDDRRDGLWEDIKSFAQSHGFRVVIIAYLRRQDEFANSLWAQKVKVGHWDCSADSWEKWIEENRFDAVLNYADRLEEFVNLFGRENMIVRRYDKRNFYGGSIFSEFLHLIGLELTPEFVIKSQTVNPSLKGNPLEIRRVMNTIPNIEVKEHYFLRNLLLQYSTLSEEEYKADIFTEEERRNFFEQYREGNVKIAREYFGEEELFIFEDESRPKWEKDNPYMQDDMIRFMGVMALHFERENERLKAELYKIRHPFKSVFSFLLEKAKKLAKVILRRK